MGGSEGRGGFNVSCRWEYHQEILFQRSKIQKCPGACSQSPLKCVVTFASWSLPPPQSLQMSNLVPRDVSPLPATRGRGVEPLTYIERVERR